MTPPSDPGSITAEGRRWSKTRWWILGVGVAAGVLVDQVTKQLADAYLRGRGLVTVIDGFLELRYARNPGAFFSMGADLSPTLRRIVFVSASVAASALILRLYVRATREQRSLRWALLLLLSGALGNLVDRVVYGEVIDFIHMFWRGVFDWATFNVADALLVAGVAMLFVDLMTGRGATQEPAPAASASQTPANQTPAQQTPAQQTPASEADA